RDEPIASAGNRFDKRRGVRGIIQRVPDFTDRGVDARFHVDEYIFTPKSDLLMSWKSGWSAVGAVYDRPRCRNRKIVGGHRPPLQRTGSFCFPPITRIPRAGSGDLKAGR